MKRIVCVIILFGIFNNFLNAQTYSTRYKIKIPESIVVTKVNKVPCDTTLLGPKIVKEESSLQKKKSILNITTIDTIPKRDSITYKKVLKSIETQIKPFDGWANLTSDKEDKSILHVNYWLNKKNTVEPGIIISTKTYKVQCDGENKLISNTKDTLKKTVNYHLIKVDSCKYDSIKKLSWFQTCPQIIEVYKNKEDKEIDYYLVDKYDRNADYTIKLDNREFISFKYTTWDFGPLVIPFKYRFGYTPNNITVDPEFQAELNVGVFGGYTSGRYRKRYESEELKDLSRLSVTYGGFLSISTVALDSMSTRKLKNPLPKDKTKTIGTLSPGLGIMATIYNFQIGIFSGIDVGFGSNAKNWNFNNRLWVGFGISYAIKPPFFK